MIPTYRRAYNGEKLGLEESGPCDRESLATVRPPSYDELQVDERDIKTKDNWIKRHPEMTRLTGMHPFNSEPPAYYLTDNFITPTTLHYTRNHGAVPKLDWDTHEVKVSIYNKYNELINEKVLKMDEILENGGKEITIPVTLTCAGNRRKEENMTKKSIGFSWNTSATSTANWTGVRLSKILKYCGLNDFDDDDDDDVLDDRFVWITGADELPNGYYETCLPLGMTMNPASDVILSYKVNGELLQPDRGYPIRVIIPGWIGGRMTKWISHIQVRQGESTSFYHKMDNMILPPIADKDFADKHEWWLKREYKFNELNINSAMTHPAHGTCIGLDGPDTTLIKGYAYTGGGRKITRVEISLDMGGTWELAELKHFEKPNKYGKFWAWSFFDFKVQVSRLLGVQFIACRAWDSANNTQPRNITWNVMGMGNSSWFKIGVEAVTMPTGNLGLRFIHPTQDAGMKNELGWMEPDLEGNFGKGGRQQVDTALKAREITATKYAEIARVKVPQIVEKEELEPTSTTNNCNMVEELNLKSRYTMKEVAKHDTEDDCWFVVNDVVYDCTAFLKQHPGGADSIVINAGTDCTEDFTDIHSDRAWKMLKDYAIGYVWNDAMTSATTSVASSFGEPPTFSPMDFYPEFKKTASGSKNLGRF